MDGCIFLVRCGKRTGRFLTTHPGVVRGVTPPAAKKSLLAGPARAGGSPKPPPLVPGYDSGGRGYLSKSKKNYLRASARKRIFTFVKIKRTLGSHFKIILGIRSKSSGIFFVALLRSAGAIPPRDPQNWPTGCCLAPSMITSWTPASSGFKNAALPAIQRSRVKCLCLENECCSNVLT